MVSPILEVAETLLFEEGCEVVVCGGGLWWEGWDGMEWYGLLGRRCGGEWDMR